VAGDLARVVGKARLVALQDAEDVAHPTPETPRPDGVVRWEHFVRALHEVRPSQLQRLDVRVPAERWSDVGGYEATKLRLRQLVQWQWQHPEEFGRLGVPAASGVLLHGPPGCGKTLMAHALAGECAANFVSVKATELFSQYLGESEAALRSVFAKARAAAPCILFFDEIDSLAAGRDLTGGGDGGGQGGGVGERMLATLLNEMDGVEGSRGVVVLAATNRFHAIDKALLRPGRIDQSILVPLPDADARERILRVTTEGRGVPLSGAVDMGAMARRAWAEGRSGADLSRLCQEAALVALRRDEGAASVCADDFEAAAISLHFTNEALEAFGRMAAALPATAS
jgi:SpoVK/Ycf46/Vps4 family AAA+-type ATPase